MNVMTFTEFRNNLTKVLDKVHNDHKPVLITRQNANPVVVISLEDFQAYKETAYLMASPKNAARLNEAMNQVSAIDRIGKINLD